MTQQQGPIITKTLLLQFSGEYSWAPSRDVTDRAPQKRERERKKEDNIPNLEGRAALYLQFYKPLRIFALSAWQRLSLAAFLLTSNHRHFNAYWHPVLGPAIREALYMRGPSRSQAYFLPLTFTQNHSFIHLSVLPQDRAAFTAGLRTREPCPVRVWHL